MKPWASLCPLLRTVTLTVAVWGSSGGSGVMVRLPATAMRLGSAEACTVERDRARVVAGVKIPRVLHLQHGSQRARDVRAPDELARGLASRAQDWEGRG